MSQLFSVSIDNINLHIKNIIADDELDNSVVGEYSVTASSGKKYKTKIYNLDMIISVGYRVKSNRGIKFRKWASSILKQYLFNGYAANNNLILFEVEILKPYSFLIKLFFLAKEKIVIIDNYADQVLFDMLSNITILITIYTTSSSYINVK